MTPGLPDPLKPLLVPPYTRAVALARRARPRTFVFDGRERRCFDHHYNETWRNERAVEVPLAREALRGDALEVGNVLAHYGVRGHTVVDKYERAPGVLNVDIVEYAPGRSFDSIVSISTIEHIGFDEDVRDPGKPRAAVAHLRSLLAPGGTLFVTFPLGYNPGVDVLAEPSAADFDTVGYLRRSADWRHWTQAPWEDVRHCVYDPERAATAIAVAVARG